MAQSSVDLWIRTSEAELAASSDHNGVGHEEEYTPEQYMETTNASSSSQYHDPQYPPAAGGSYDEVYSEIPDILCLAHFCALAHPPRDDSEQALFASRESWEPVREWMRTHSAEEVKIAAEQRDDAGKTALHFACQNVPPEDIVNVFLIVAMDVVQWPDSFGWLPIHYACAYGASATVIKALAESYPASKTTRDRKGRTPLHFALGTSNVHSPDVIVVLGSTGAASYEDDNGMLPLHYACAYGASEDCLYVLTDTYHDAIATMDKRGRTPLHFALSNAGRKSAPAAVRLLLSLNRNLVNAHEGSPLPLRVLAEFSSTVPKHEKEQRESCKSCLKHLLGAQPVPTADFFNALQSLPDFLQEVAVVMKVVQELLNHKIAQRFPTMILMLDFYVQIMVITLFSITSLQSVDLRFETNPDDPRIDLNLLYPLYVGASYFLLREVIQIVSLVSLGALRIWAYEPSNWLNVIYVCVIYFWTVNMTTGNLEREFFRTGAAVSITFLWTKFMSFLRNMLIAFAVFTGGVFHVMRRLAAFLVCLIIILVAFSRMFFTIFRQSDYCLSDFNSDFTHLEVIENLQCEQHNTRPWCDSWDAFLAIYTMLLGEVDGSKFEDDFTALMLFVVFMFLVVILLANVLIAIVTDSYKIIQEQRSAIVFWTNRLNFIAQMDAIANGPWKTLARQALGLSTSKKYDQNPGVSSSFGKNGWKKLMELFDDDFDDKTFSIEFLFYCVMRLITLLIVIPLWVILGILTAGWLWPPQIREFLFTSTLTKHNSETEREEESRRMQLGNVQAEIKIMREELRQELALDRTQVVQTKSLVTERKIEIQSEMKHIKRLVTMLFEQQGNM